MKLFEGYKKAVEIYNNYTNTQGGRDYVTKLNTMGVSKEYMVWVTSNVIVSKIPLYLVLNAYKDWKRYVVKYYSDNNIQLPNINQLGYNQVIKITNECKRKYAKPSPIYDKDGIYVGVLSTFQMANMLPINTTWCITKTPHRYAEFNNDNQKCLYIINNKNADPHRRVIAVCSIDNVEYWDSKNHRMEEEEVMLYEKTLPIEVENIIHNFAYQILPENKQYKTNTNMNKKLIRLNESDLHRIVKESVKKVLRENTNDDIYSDIDGKIKTVETYLSIEDYVWNWWDLYEEALGEPMWPQDERGQREGAERLLRVLKSMKGEDNYLQKYGDWTDNDREYSRTDNQTWGEYYRNNLDKMANYNG